VTDADRTSSTSEAGMTSQPNGDEEKGTGHPVPSPRSPGSAPSTERARPDSAPPRREDAGGGLYHALVCPACANLSVTERNGTIVCRHCGYTGARPES
jgi:hypothetical protein